MKITQLFTTLARTTSKTLGNSRAFITAILLVFFWVMAGPFFEFSVTWQLVINTFATITTFLMVFLLQNTQNRDTKAMHLKLDEIIRAMENTHNRLLKVEQLSDEELDELLQHYENIASDVKKRLAKGDDDKGTPEIKQ